jgi:cellulose synthase/poly-beta-1,6-N-acetylglucosamine synthase-like glycosyltransferase
VADVSVIVPARNAAASLRRTLAALSRQDFGGDCEVIVVDDGSTDGTADVARAAGATVVELPENLGSADARNAGAAVARAPVLAFTDADCEPAPGWVRAGLRALEEADLVQGRVEPPPGVEVGPFDRTVWVTRESGLYETANLFMRRELFERVGGFWRFLRDGSGPAGEERLPGLLPSMGGGRFGGHFGEDIWLGWRARRAGARTAFTPEALVHHEVVRRGPLGLMAEQARLRHFPAITRQVPELREHFYFARWFLTRRSAAFDLALASLLASLGWRRRWPLAGALPYALLLAPPEVWRHPRALAAALATAPADAVGFVALAAGSAAARTVVL